MVETRPFLCVDCRPKRIHRKKIKEAEEEESDGGASSGSNSPKLESPMDFTPADTFLNVDQGQPLGAWPTTVQETVVTS
jgi:hypothetical protein